MHIDFGDCFEVAMTREKFPEKVHPDSLTTQSVHSCLSLTLWVYADSVPANAHAGECHGGFRYAAAHSAMHSARFHAGRSLPLGCSLLSAAFSSLCRHRGQLPFDVRERDACAARQQGVRHGWCVQLLLSVHPLSPLLSPPLGLRVTCVRSPTCRVPVPWLPPSTVLTHVDPLFTLRSAGGLRVRPADELAPDED